MVHKVHNFPKAKTFMHHEIYRTMSLEGMWKHLQKLVGHEKAENCIEIVQELISWHSAMGRNVSLKLHFLHSYLDFFAVNMGAVSDEHAVRFCQYISETEKRYSGKRSPNTLAVCCWSLIRETPAGEKNRKKKMKWVFNELFLGRILYIETLFIIWYCIL